MSCDVSGCDNEIEYKLDIYEKSGEVDFDRTDEQINLCEEHYKHMYDWMSLT